MPASTVSQPQVLLARPTVAESDHKVQNLEAWPLTNPIELARCDGTLSCCTRSYD